MKSDSAASKLLSLNLSAAAFRAFFETLETPAAVCDSKLRLLAANPAFEVLCGIKEAMGQELDKLLPGVGAALPADGASSEVEVRLGSGQLMVLALSRREDTVAVLARQSAEPSMSKTLAAAGRALTEQARVEQTLLEFGRDVAGATSEEEVMGVVTKGVRALFPGRTFALRVVDPRTWLLTSLYAEGRLKEGANEPLVVKRTAAQKTHLDTTTLPPERVSVIEGEVPLMFVGSVRGVSAPLVASGQLFGAINVEYPEGITADYVSDDRILTQLANQVAVAIRNAKLIDELTFVRTYLEELLEHGNALIWAVNRERKVLVFNRQLGLLTGFSKQEVLGKDFLGVVPEHEQMALLRVFNRALRGEKVMNFETALLSKSGREVRVSLALSSVPRADGEVEGVIAIGQDLTVVKDLERRVIQAEKLASLGQLAASVVHEINNPMTAISSYAEALLQDALASPAVRVGEQEKLKRILSSSERILRFTRDLVWYARPAKEKPEEVEVEKALELAVSFCDHVLSRQAVEVRRDFEPVPKIQARKGNLVQVFINLITNACHAMASGGVVTLRVDGDAGFVRIRVEDTGAGIAPEVLERVFEPFFTTKPEGKGSGLGLSIVQSIVESHGGTVTVESLLGRGTTFVVKLPVAAATDEGYETQSRSSS